MVRDSALVDLWDEHGFGVTLFEDGVTGQPVCWGGLQHSTIGTGECLTVGQIIESAVEDTGIPDGSPVY